MKKLLYIFLVLLLSSQAMAVTKYYARSSSAAAGPTGEVSTDTDNFTTVPTSKNTPLDMSTSKGSSQVSVTGVYNTAGASYAMVRMFVGPALEAQTLTASAANYTFAVGNQESNGNMNLYPRFFMYVWRSGTGNVKTIITPTSEATESATAETGYTTTATGEAGDFSIELNDRIVVEMWWYINNTREANYTASFYFEGATDPVDGTATSDAATYFQLPQTLTEPTASFTPIIIQY